MKRMMAIRILIVDDHPVVLRGLRSLLETREAWEACGEARTGIVAVKQVKLLKPDIVIIDISMPAMNGIEAIRQVHEFDPHIGILTLTMHESESMFREVMGAGAHAYVLKSDLNNRLMEAVDALSENRAFFTPGVSQAILKGFIHDDNLGHSGARDSDVLRPRQRQVLKLLAHGKSNK